MICPRCGFPSPSDPCILCGQADFNQFEMKRFSEQTAPRLEFTLIIQSRNLVSSSPLFQIDGPLSAKTSEFEPRWFFFFSDGQTPSLFPFLRQIEVLRNWSLLVNGRTRPFTQELWLPLLELTEVN